MASLEPSGSSISPGISRILVKSEFTFSRGHRSRVEEKRRDEREKEKEIIDINISFILLARILYK